uniref:GFA family protein n=1 Tax=Piscirickettsia litoralis TaxID=1891921 RepID=UPI00373FDE49
MGNCHCRDCQRWTGCAYEPAMAFPKTSLKLHGVIRFHDKISDQGNTVSRGFLSRMRWRSNEQKHRF